MVVQVEGSIDCASIPDFLYNSSSHVSISTLLHNFSNSTRSRSPCIEAAEHASLQHLQPLEIQYILLVHRSPARRGLETTANLESRSGTIPRSMDIGREPAWSSSRYCSRARDGRKDKAYKRQQEPIGQALHQHPDQSIFTTRCHHQTTPQRAPHCRGC